MTEKLFWTDPYLKEFTANLQDQFPLSDGHAVVLDRTCFYATSGGQPNDLGTLNGATVRDVRIEKDQLLHIIDQPVTEPTVRGKIDWMRRFDHMQQHSGQHILSAAFYNLFHAETSSFHLGESYCSIELDRPTLTGADCQKAEDEANRVISGAVSVETFFVDPEKAKEYPLRKQSDLQEALRIVQIGDFDLSPCSGTHVKNTGEVGMVFITGMEKLSQTLKVSFLCGNRVARQYHSDLEILKQLSKQLTTSAAMLPESLLKLQEQLKETRRELTKFKEEQWKQEALQLYSSAEEFRGMKFVLRIWKRPYGECRFIAQKLTEQPDVAGILISSEDGRAVFFKHPKNNFDVRPVFQKFLQMHSVRGGGPPHLMEAGGFQTTPDEESAIRALWEGQS
jgi:alanyl-tRNA synthetase